MRIYLAGRMTGLPDYNYPAFHAEAARLRELGLTVINPAENFDGRQDLPRRVYLEEGARNVLRSEAVAVMTGWWESEGARGEVFLAQFTGRPVYWAHTITDSAGSMALEAAPVRVQTVGEAIVEKLNPPPRPEPKVRETVLEEATRIVGGDRRRDYDHPLPNHERIGAIWGVQLEKYLSEATPREPVPPRTVALMMIGLKLAREAYTAKRDSIVDIAGYAACIDLMDEAQEGR